MTRPIVVLAFFACLSAVVTSSILVWYNVTKQTSLQSKLGACPCATWSSLQFPGALSGSLMPASELLGM